MNVVGCSEQFWKFIRVVELPVFALSKDRRIVFWNPGMEDLTKVRIGWCGEREEWNL